MTWPAASAERALGLDASGYMLSEHERKGTMREKSDTEALDELAAYMNRPGPWNGGDVCDVAAELLVKTGREILDNADHPGPSEVGVSGE